MRNYYNDTCVACGQKIGNDDHHCDTRTIARIEAVRKGRAALLEAGGKPPRRLFGERLREGFAMLSDFFFPEA